MTRTDDLAAYGRDLADTAPPLTDDQVRRAARVLAEVTTEPAAA